MLTLLIAATLGGGCGVQAGYGYSGYAPTYGYRQTYVTYGATPTYYQPTTYQAPYVAPKVDYQAVVGEYLREEYRAKKEEEQAARLARIEALLQKPTPPVQYQAPPPVPYQPVGVPSKASPQSPPFPTGQSPPPIPEKNVPSSFGGVGPPPLTGSPGGGDFTGTPGGSDVAVTQIFRNRCATCHAAPANKAAGIVLLDPAGNLPPMSAPLMLAIQEDVKTGRMPKGGHELPDNELAIISGWVGDHAPEIAAFLAQGIGR